MKTDHILESLSKVDENPTESIIKQIRMLLNTGQLKPGDRLPAERKMAERFGVGRTHVRDALKKLEFYNILKTLPQSGSVVAGMEMTALDGLISDVLQMDSHDFYSLVEMRAILETNAARLCAIRRTEEDLREIEKAMNKYIEKVEENGSAMEEDLYFHRTIAQGSKNMVLKSMMMIITPDIMTNYNKFNVCKTNFDIPISEHRLLFEYIKNHDANGATNIMSQHLTGVLSFAKTQTLF